METQDKIFSDPVSVSSSIAAILAPYDIPDSTVNSLACHLAQSSKLSQFLMQFQHTLEEPTESRALKCALSISTGYFVGGFIPLVPYFFVGSDQVLEALYYSVGIIVTALFTFGYGKTCFVSGWSSSRNIKSAFMGGVQMVVVGGIAAGSAMLIVRIFQNLVPRTSEI